MEEKNLTERESLELIAQMIRNTQNKLQERSGVPLLVWGYTTVIVALVVWFMISRTGDYRWNYLWFMITVVGGSYLLYSYRHQKPSVKTYIDRVLSQVWMVFGITGFLVSVLSIFFWNMTVLFLVLLLMGMGTTLSGLIIQFKPLTFCGALGALCSIGCLMLTPLDSILVFALVFVVMMIIPGHILNYQGRKLNQEERVC